MSSGSVGGSGDATATVRADQKFRECPRCESACAGCQSAKVEYDYMDFGRRTVDFALVGGFIPVNLDVDQRVSQVKVGLNYRFSGMNPKSAAC